MSILPLNSHIWVSASAGTGKTTILTNRVLQLLLSGAKPSSILCLTYTNAAAAEMKQRIMDRLGSWVIASEGALAEEIGKLFPHSSVDVLNRARSLFFEVSENPDSLNIQTIHSFCQSILRRFPLEASVSPYFTVIDEQRCLEITEQSLEELLREVQQGKHADLGQNIEATITEMSEYGFRQFIYEAISENGRWRTWLDQPGGLTACAQELRAFLDINNQQSSCDLIAGSSSRKFPDHLVDPVVGLQGDEHSITTARKQELSALYRFLNTHKAKAIQQLTTEIHALLSLVEVSDADIESYIGAWLTQKNEPKHAIKKLLESEGPGASLIQAELERVQVYRYEKAHLGSYTLTNHLTHILSAIFEKYEAKCREQGYLDYHDLLHKTRQFLSQDEHALGWVMFKLDGGIDHVLVDEAQDTNPLQWQIIKAITNEYFSGQGRKEVNRTVFIVGDDKQSIFSFQDANLDDYKDMKHWLMDAAKAAKQDFHEEKLLTSYRSTPTVIDAVNQVTCALNLGAPHIAHRKDEGRVEIWDLAEQNSDEDDNSSATEILASQIANKVTSWINDKRILPSTGKAIEPSDIMILVRKRSALSVQLASELRHHNIPVQGVEKMVLRDNLAVQDVLALMQWCLLQSDDYSLACVLRSPICDISEAQLFEISHLRDEQTLWQQLNHKADELGLKHEIAKLSGFKDKLGSMSIYAFIYSTLFESGVANHFVKRLGQEVTIPLNALLEQAKLFEAQHPQHFGYFIEYIKQFHQEITSKESITNCVRIMTVHGSKGLEAPVVMLADSNTSMSHISGFEWLEHQGHKIPCYLPPKQDRSPALEAKIELTRQKALAENERLLYVAMTRARDELYVTGQQSRINDNLTWYQILSKTLKIVEKY